MGAAMLTGFLGKKLLDKAIDKPEITRPEGSDPTLATATADSTAKRSEQRRRLAKGGKASTILSQQDTSQGLGNGRLN